MPGMRAWSFTAKAWPGTIAPAHAAIDTPASNANDHSFMARHTMPARHAKKGPLTQAA
jgi:hypothetical protein